MNIKTENKKIITISADLFLQNIIKRFKNAIKEHPAGFTFNIIKLKLKTNFSSDIYLVGQQEYGQKFEINPKPEELAKWVCKHFAAIYKKGGLIGGWWDEKGTFFLDVVAEISGYENAMSSGWMNSEKEIYHPYSNRSLKVKTPHIEKYLSRDS